jgi:hypothetical protein
MVISPPLIEGQQVRYELVEHLPEGLYGVNLTRAQQRVRKTDYDYFGWTINRPTRKLRLRTYFPERLEPTDYGVEVRYASAAPGIPSVAYQLEEQGRLERPSLDGPDGGRYSLKLDVSYPMIGLVYILRWLPLESKGGRQLPLPDLIDIPKPSGTLAEPTEYNPSAFRDMLQAAFTAQELEQFCRDRTVFRPVVANLRPDFSLVEITDELVLLCQNRLLFPELEDELKSVRPRQYENHRNALHKVDGAE